MEGFNFALSKIANRVLRDYPAAREQLAKHDGKTIRINAGPLAGNVRITRAGETEPLGSGTADEPAVHFTVPAAALPGLAAGDEAAFRQVTFSGDSELAALLSSLVRGLKWNVEEDLSQIVGDIAAHRIVDTFKQSHAWRVDATARFNANVAEYFTEETQLFVDRPALEKLAVANETLRDDIARLEARLDLLNQQK